MKEEIKTIIENHQHWLKEDCEGWQEMRADLRRANLSGADLSGADLSGADLSGADLRCANLSGADLSGADLRCANLRCANLSGADLRCANLSGADLRCANLRCANLSGADLSDVVYNEYTSFFSLQCPEEGSYIAWKKCSGLIVKLEISADAKRSSATTRKCRASKAVVLEIQNLDGSKADAIKVNSNFDTNFVYEVGKTVEVNDFNDCRWVECTSGIHHFITRQEAVNY